MSFDCSCVVHLPLQVVDAKFGEVDARLEGSLSKDQVARIELDQGIALVHFRTFADVDVANPASNFANDPYRIALRAHDPGRAHRDVNRSEVRPAGRGDHKGRQGVKSRSTTRTRQHRCGFH